MPTKQVCPRYRQNWVHLYRFRADGGALRAVHRVRLIVVAERAG